MKEKDINPVDPIMLLPLLLLPIVLFFVMFWYNLANYDALIQQTEEPVCYPDTHIGDGIKGYTLPLPPTISLIEIRVESLRKKTEEIEVMLKEHMSKR